MAMPRHCLLLLTASLLTVPPLLAQAHNRGSGDRIYCWVQNGRKTCGNVVPPEATNASRTVIDGRTGAAVEHLDRVLTPEEQAAATEQRRQQARAEAEAAAARRRDLAMVMTYNTEADLMRAYDERVTVADDAIRSSLIGEKSMRTLLTSLLDQANILQLNGGTVGQPLLEKIRVQHGLLDQHMRVLQEQRRNRVALDVERQDALIRYRAHKGGATGGSR